MRKAVRLITTASLLAVATPIAAHDVKAGVDAWDRGDYKTAVDQWRSLAVAGNPDAQYNLAQAYKLGRGVPVDPTLAESWFHKAALQGHFQAETNYGLALFTANKKAEALPWLEKSVARDDARAQLVLGTMLFNGDGVGRDYPRAYALMTRASQQGLKSASETLAQMDQYITPDDRQKGIALAQRYAATPKGAVQAPGNVKTAAAPASRQTPPKPTPVAAKPVTQQPIARPKPVVVTAKSTGTYRIQLGAFSSQSNAEAQWAKVRGRLTNATPVYVRAGKLIRLQAGGYPSSAEAKRGCAASGVNCVVVAP